jgi:hypothetical protein
MARRSYTSLPGRECVLILYSNLLSCSTPIAHSLHAVIQADLARPVHTQPPASYAMTIGEPDLALVTVV